MKQNKPEKNSSRQQQTDHNILQFEIAANQHQQLDGGSNAGFFPAPGISATQSASFEQQTQLHRMVKMKKNMNEGGNTLSQQNRNNSPDRILNDDEQSEVHSAQIANKEHQAVGRLTHEEARTMRISQERILREGGSSSLESVQGAAAVKAQIDEQASNQTGHNGRTISSAAIVHERNFASEGLSFSVSNDEQASHQQTTTGQKLVKKVAIKEQNASSVLASSNVTFTGHNNVLASVRQSSLTERQGPIVSNGPHTRSKSSAIGTSGNQSAGMHMQQRPGTNRKSNSRGRATPENRLTHQLSNGASQSQHQSAITSVGNPQQMLMLQEPIMSRSKQRKEQYHEQSSLEQIEKSSITIASPTEDESNGQVADLNTSMPLPESKSHTRMLQFEKNQNSMGTVRQNEPVFKAAPEQSSVFNEQVFGAESKAMMTPSGATYQHTRKQSTTRHRSNSKKRGSINTSIRRQISRSPCANQRANSFAVATTTEQTTSVNPATLNSKASIKSQQHHQELIHSTLVAGTSSKATNQQQQAMIVALAASAFNQEHNATVHGADQLLEQQLGELQASQAVHHAQPPQGHKLTPLAQSESRVTGEPAQQLIGVDLQQSDLEVKTIVEEEGSDNKQGANEFQKLEEIREDAANSENALLNSSQHHQNELSSSSITMKPTSIFDKQKEKIHVYAGRDSSNQRSAATGNKLHASSTSSASVVQEHLYNEHNHEPHARKQTQEQNSNSEFSSFTKEHMMASMLEAKHQTAQKSQRPGKTSLTAGADAQATSESPTTREKRQNASVYAAPSQPQHQLMHLIKESSTSNQKGNSSHLQQRNTAHGENAHEQSSASSAQSSRTAHDVYLKQALKQNTLIGGGPFLPTQQPVPQQTKAMSSRTVNSSGTTPYEHTQSRAETSHAVVQELYGSQQVASKPQKTGERSNATFHDFRPKTSIGMANEGDSKSQQMMLDRDVEGLSPEPRAEIVLTKNEIERAARATRVQGQSQIISIPKQDSRSMHFEKLKFSQIEQANNSLQKDAAKKIIKSERLMQQSKHHAKSFSGNTIQQPAHEQNAEESTDTSGIHQQLYYEPQSMSTLNSNLLLQAEAVTKSATKTSNLHSSAQSMLVQNWIHSSDQLQQSTHQQSLLPSQVSEEAIVSSQEAIPTVHSKKPATVATSQTYRQIGIGTTTRQRFENNKSQQSQQVMSHGVDEPSQVHSRSMFSSQKQGIDTSSSLQSQVQTSSVLPHGISSGKKHQSLLMKPSSKYQRTTSAAEELQHQIMLSALQNEHEQQPPEYINDDQTHSQKVLMQSNHHELSEEHMPQSHLKSVQVEGNENNSVSAGMSTHKVLKSQASGTRSTRESILQAEESHEKILGPPSHQPSATSSEIDQQQISKASGARPGNLTTQKNKQVLRSQNAQGKFPDSVTSGQLSANHNAYANNAEDYFKKAKALASGASSATTGTKTPGERLSKKKLEQSNDASSRASKQEQETATDKSSVSNTMTGQADGSVQQTSSIDSMTVIGSLELKKKSSAKASPELAREELLAEDTDANRILETESALTVTAAPTHSFVSQGSMVVGQISQQMNVVSASNSVISDSNKQSFGMSRSRLSQYVLQSNTASDSKQQIISGKSSFHENQPESSISGTSTTKTPEGQPTANSKKTVISSNQVQVVQSASKSASNENELMRKKNEAKMIGGQSGHAIKQQQNLQMQHFLAKNIKDSQKSQNASSLGKESQVQARQSPIKERLPNAIHDQMKANQAYASRQKDNESVKQHKKQSQQQQHQQQTKQQQSKSFYREFLQSQLSENNRSETSSTHKMTSSQIASEGRSHTAMNHEMMINQHENQLGGVNQDNNRQMYPGLSASEHSSARFNMNYPARPVTDFDAPTSAQRSQHFFEHDGKGEDGNIHLHQYNANFEYSSSRFYPINEEMPQRMNFANMVERVEKKLKKNELLLPSQLSTTMTSNNNSHSSKSHSQQSANTEDKQYYNNGSSMHQQKKPEVLSHLVTFEAHLNSVVGLQAFGKLDDASVASFAKDNTVKVWSINTQKPTQFIANNRAAAVNLQPKVVLKKQVKNQARPSEKLSSFTFFNANKGGDQMQQQFQSSILITGCTDKVLRLYELDSSEEPDLEAYERASAVSRKAPQIVREADVIKPSIRLTGQHRGVISSIVQLGADNDRFLTGCSDGFVRMFSLSALYTSEDADEALCTFDEGNSGVEQICPMSDTAFLSTGFDNTVRLWDIRAPEHQRILKEANFGKVNWLEKYNQSEFASASNDGYVNFWDTRKMKLLRQCELPGFGSISSVQFAKKRECMLVAHDHKISVINIASGGQDSQLIEPSERTTTTKSQQRGPFTVLASHEAIGPRIKDSNEHALESENSWGKGAKITSMVYSESEKRVYVGGYNKKITVWNLNWDAFN